MYIVDKTYFIKKLSIPNTEEHNSEQAIQLETSIDLYARQFLQVTLGNVLFSDLDSNVTDGALEVGAPLKWLNLVNGCSYTLDGKDYTWKGLIYSEGMYKNSMLAHYVYVNQYNDTVNTMLGQVGLQGKNSEVVNPTSHLVGIWNDFVKMYQGENCYFNKQTIHRGVIFTDYFQETQESGYVSYLKFLTDNKEDYPTFSAGTLEFKNSLL